MEAMDFYGERELPEVRSATAEMVTTRQAQEVQAAMVIAKKFPRSETESFNRIMRACKRKSLAEQSMYEYPRGDTKVTGPSIRLAEAMAQNWGNIDFGIIELEQRSGESQVMAYAWDLETNTRQTKIFSVPHVRATKKGNRALSDPRDIYELVANQGARRLRACILGIIPGDVIDAAIAQCNETLMGQSKVPLADLVREAAALFRDQYGVTVPMLEKYIGCRSESFSMNDLIRLKKVYRSLQDGMSKREDYFEMLPLTEDSEIGNPWEGREKKEEAKKQEKAEPKSVKSSDRDRQELPETPQTPLDQPFN